MVFGHRLFIAGQQISDREYLILISDHPLKHGRQIYGERWGIEVFFGACKSRGFNFEDTHLTKLDRINTLIFILAIAFIWALKTGEMLLEYGHQIPIKQFKKRKSQIGQYFQIRARSLKNQTAQLFELISRNLFFVLYIDKIIKNKLGLLKLAKQLSNVTQACQVMGYSRDSFSATKN